MQGENKDSRPFVSVVMPSFNHAEFIGQAIESVLNQTYDNFEFIIADDASEDNSTEIIRRYDDPRIQFKQIPQNTGFSACEYIYEQAKGKYIASICSDDMWKPTALEKRVAFLEENDEYGCCFCQPEVLNQDEEDISRTKAFESLFTVDNYSKERWFRNIYLNGNCICAPSMCMRRSVYEQLGPFKYQFRQLQDYEYWLRLLQISNIYVFPEKLIIYRLHQNGKNRNISTQTEDVRIRDATERRYMLFDIMDHVSEEFFIKAFLDDIVLKPGTEGFCLECEKFGIMLKAAAVPPHAAIFYFFKHYNDSEFRSCIEKYYNITRKDFWNLTGTDYDINDKEYNNKVMAYMLAEQVQSLKQELKKKNEELENLKKLAGYKQEDLSRNINS